MSRELPEVQAGFRKGRGTRDQIANIHWIMEKEIKKKRNLLHWLHWSLWLCGSQLWKILKEMGMPDLLICFWKTCMQVKKQQNWHGTTNCFQIRKGVCQGCILSPCLFNFYAEYIMQNDRLYEAQEGLRGATPCPRLGAAAVRRYPMCKVKSSGCEEILHVQGKEQQLRFAGAAVKRYPNLKVRETQVRR